MASVHVEIEDYDYDSESVSKEKEIINVAHFVPDTKKKPEQIRATCGPHVGQRIRLKLAPFVDDDLGEKKKAIVRTSSVLRFVVSNGVQIESEIHPKLPDDFDGGESFSRQFGTLKQHGVALQVRFKPVGHIGEHYDDSKGKRKIEKLTIGKANTLYEICADQRGQERCDEIAKEYEEETRHWMGTNNHVSGQIKVMQDIDKKVAALEGKLKAVTGFIVALENLKEQGKYTTQEDELVATREMIAQAEEEIRIIGHESFENEDDEDEVNTGKNRAREHKQFQRQPFHSFSLSQLGVYMDECENQPISGLKKILAKTRDSLQLATRIQKCALRDAHLRHNWDTYESNVETRDVLENGIRREDMERLLGREATKQDVEASMRIPLRERAKIVGGATDVAAGDDRAMIAAAERNKREKHLLDVDDDRSYFLS
ncbi:unnamed protein product [Bathycoccus prasinos]